MPHHQSVVEEFGEHGFGPDADSKRSLAMGSFLYDPLNLITLNAQIAPYASSERELLYQHLSKVKKGDLLLPDRGCPGIFLLFFLQARGIDYCMRMKQDWWLELKEFTESGEKERIVGCQLPAKDRELLKEYPDIINTEIKCRLVCIELENGEKQVLCTSLMDAEKYSYEDLSELYHLRGNVEEGIQTFQSPH